MPAPFLDTLRHRRLLQDFSPGLEEHLADGLANDKPVVAYIGFDPTAPSLTIGNYVPIMLLKLFQLAGHRPVMLFGGATGRIGDPSGKSTERQLKSYEEIAENLAAQKAQAQRLLAPEEGCHDVEFVDNFDFYRDFNVIDFLREVGKTLTVNYMMAKDSVKSRLETGLSFTEFSYQLLQGYDFQCLYQQLGCTVQMGGSDQWGNITAGTEFVRRNLGGKAYGLTAPLLTKADGSKFGKSEAGNIWLDAERTSPYQFYQFWVNADDRDLVRYVRTFSLKPAGEFDEMVSAAGGPDVQAVRATKLELAHELTARVHGEEALEDVGKVSAMLFGKDARELLRKFSPEQLALVATAIPTAQVGRVLIGEGTTVVNLLAEHTSLVASKSEARRAVKNNAVSLNKTKVSDAEQAITSGDLLHGRYLLLENGKKNKLLVEVM